MFRLSDLSWVRITEDFVRAVTMSDEQLTSLDHLETGGIMWFGRGILLVIHKWVQLLFVQSKSEVCSTCKVTLLHLFECLRFSGGFTQNSTVNDRSAPLVHPNALIDRWFRQSHQFEIFRGTFSLAVLTAYSSYGSELVAFCFEMCDELYVKYVLFWLGRMQYYTRAVHVRMQSFEMDETSYWLWTYSGVLGSSHGPMLDLMKLFKLAPHRWIFCTGFLKTVKSKIPHHVSSIYCVFSIGFSKANRKVSKGQRSALQ